MSGRRLIKRRALGLVSGAAAEARVVILNGARQSGKTTLLRQIHRARGGTFTTLDDPGQLEIARSDPVGFARGFAPPVYIDEVQLGGDALVRSIKLVVDEDTTPGRFLLTGSSRFLTVPTLSESLAGRARIIDLWPFSRGELGGRTESFVDRLFEEPDAFARLRTEPLSRRDIFELVCVGGFPEVVGLAEKARGRWFEDYVRTVTLRDIGATSRVRQLSELPNVVRHLGTVTSQELNIAEAARRIEIDPQTVRSYVSLLEVVFLVYRLPAWSRGLAPKPIRHAKIHLSDCGLAAHLVRASTNSLARPGAAPAGPLLETFVAGEIMKQLSWSEGGAHPYHFRDRSGPEVDIVLEAPDGRVAGIEVKAAESIRPVDSRGLRFLRDKLGSEFAHGIVLYCGTQALPLGERISALPVSALWA